MTATITLTPVCRLCREPHPLVRSHIISRFYSEGGQQLFPRGKSGALQPFTTAVHTDPAIKLGLRQKGGWDSKLGMVQHLLCEVCEGRFSKWEDFVRRYFYGLSSPIRFQLPIKADPFFQIDYKVFKLFQLSILWRASEARGDFFAAVSLGEKHSERIRQMLLNDDPGGQDDYACALFRMAKTPELEQVLQKSNTALENFSFAPIMSRLDGGRVYVFIFGGMGWMFSVTGGALPEMLRHTYVKENGVFFLSPMNAQDFLSHFSRKVVKTGNYPRPAGV